MFRSSHIGIVLVLMATLLASGSASPAHAARPASYDRPSAEYTTPHTPWMNPRSGRVPRVLFLTYRLGMREIIEIAQRFEIDWDVFAFDMPGDSQVLETAQFLAIPPDDSEANRKRLRVLLEKEYDVVVVGNIAWPKIPRHVQRWIQDHVEVGGGLLAYINPEEDSDFARWSVGDERIKAETALGSSPRSLLQSIDAGNAPKTATESRVKLSRVGEGRVAVPHGFAVPVYQMLTPPPGRLPLEHQGPVYDYYLADVGRLIDWAAFGKPAVSLTSYEASTNAGAPAEVLFTVHSDEKLTLRPHLTTRRVSDGKKVDSQQFNTRVVGIGVTEADFPIPPLPSGDYLVDLQLYDDEGVVTFATAPLTVDSPDKLLGVRLRGDQFNAGDEIPNYACAESIRGTVAYNVSRAGFRIQVSLCDNYGRVVAVQRHDAPERDGGTSVAFEFSAGRPLSILHRVRAVLLDSKDNLVDSDESAFTYRDRYPDPFDIRVLVWAGLGRTHLAQYVYDRLGEAGFDLIWTPFASLGLTEATGVVMANLHVEPSLFFPFPVRPRPKSIEPAEGGGGIRVPSISNDRVLRKAAREFDAAAESTSRFSTVYFDVASEAALTLGDQEVCYSEESLSCFRGRLREWYGSIGSLNEAWQSDYHSFEQITPPTLELARNNGSGPAWIDFRRHMDREWAGFFQHARDVVSVHAPMARIGFTASNDPGHASSVPGLSGCDFRALSDAVTLCHPYVEYSPQLELMRDLGRPGVSIGTGWTGGYSNLNRGGRDGQRQSWLIWRGLLRGATDITVWQASGMSDGTLIGTTLAPDFTWYPFFEPSLETIQRVRRGVGKQLRVLRRGSDAVVVVYSRSSQLAMSLDGDTPGMWEELSGVTAALTGAGLHYRFIDDQSLEAYGEIWNRPDVKMVVVPCATALPIKAAQALEQFTRLGGTVVAVGMPSCRYDHTAPYRSDRLDTLFGVKPTSGDEPARGVLHWSSERLYDEQMPVELKPRAPLVPSGAELIATVDGAPAATRHEYGQGTAYLLNFSLASFLIDAAPRSSNDCTRFRTEDDARFVSALFRGLAKKGKLSAATRLENPVPGMHTYRFGDSDLEIVGVLCDEVDWLPGANDSNEDRRSPRSATVVAPERSYWNDVFSGKKIGWGDRVEVSLRPGKLRLLARKSYRVRGVSVDLNEHEITAGETITATIQIDTIGEDESEQTSAPRAGQHVCRVELEDPSGKQLRHYSKNLVAQAGLAEYSVTSAINDVPGEWRLIVTDIVSGISSGREFVVRPHARTGLLITE